jgi:hypothetical protein
MSVLEDLHDEYMKDIYELGLLINSVWDSHDESLSAGKILVNLSTNTSNLETLLKLTVCLLIVVCRLTIVSCCFSISKSIELRTIANRCTPAKKSLDHELNNKLEDILQRYLTFYCNVSDMIVKELKHQCHDTHSSQSWLINPIPHGQGAVYFEFFDHVSRKYIAHFLCCCSISI